MAVDADEHRMASAAGERNRVQVLRLCGSVLALLLLLAGVVSWQVDEPALQVVRGSAEAEAMRADDAAARAAPATDVADSTFRRSVAGPTGPRQASTSFTCSLGAFRGLVEVHADGVLWQRIEVPSDAAVSFGVPGEAREVRFAAAGWRDKLWHASVDPAPTHVVFQPDAAVRVVLAGLQAPGDLEWRMGAPVGWSARRCLPADAAAPTEIAFPSGHAWGWQATQRQAGRLLVLQATEPALQPGEVRTVVLDAASLPAHRYRVVGVTAALLPHLIVRAIPDPVPGDGRVPVRMELDAEGAFTVASAADCTFALDVANASGALQVEPGQGEQLLRSAVPLVGFCWRETDGGLRRFALQNEARQRSPHGPLVHVWARPLGERLIVTAAGEAARVVQAVDVPDDADLVDVAALSRHALAAITVRVRGTAPSRSLVDITTAELELCGPGASVTQRLVTPSCGFGALEPGTYRVRWKWAGAPREWIGDAVTVHAGEMRELTTPWPALTTWTGEVLGHTDVEPGRRFQCVRWGQGARFYDGPQRGIAADGTFTLALLEQQEPDPVVEFRQGLLRVPGEVVSCDRLRHHLVVRPAAGLRWVTLQVEGVGGRWCAVFDRDREELPDAIVWSHEPRELAVMPGAVLPGALYGANGPGDQPLAWIQLDGSREQVLLRPALLRIVEVRQDGAQERSLGLVGPNGQWGGSWTLPPRGSVRIPMPCDTRGILLWQRDANGLTTREVPVGPEPVLRVDDAAAALDLRLGPVPGR